MKSSNQTAKEWLKRAMSNLACAQLGKTKKKNMLYEDFCFDAQQGAEKVLKALCIANQVSFPKTHDISYLIELLEKAGVDLPDELQGIRILTEYAVETRYPGHYEPVTKAEYIKAIIIAEKLICWVKDKLVEKK